MPRPKLKSDDEVLEAATVVLKRCGPIEFTLSGVAKEVGLSRAALIQRFTNRDTLLVRMMERGVEQVRHYLNAIPIGAGPQGLWEFLQVLVRSMNTRNDFSVNYLISGTSSGAGATHACDPAEPRGGGGIRKRLPRAPAAAELLLHSVIAGATMQWAVDPDGELADHVLAQIAAILCLMFPEHDDFQLLQAHA
ncbi:macrolide 2'-phosphotransferase [Escherichia coli]|nr:macrolide 2'-phosphotransferase [Escherichia coli]